MNIVINGENKTVKQVRKQLDKVVDVISIADITYANMIECELVLIEVEANSLTRSKITQIVNIVRANVVDISSDTMTIESTADEWKINSLINLLYNYGIRELSRTGRVSLIWGGGKRYTGRLVNYEKAETGV